MTPEQIASLLTRAADRLVEATNIIKNLRLEITQLNVRNAALTAEIIRLNAELAQHVRSATPDSLVHWDQ